MGKRGPIAKPPSQLHGRSKPNLTLLEGEDFDPGDPPFAHQREEWDIYWGSPAGAVARPEDKPAVVRLFKLRANFEASLAILSKISETKEFMMVMAFEEIPVSGWTCLRTL